MGVSFLYKERQLGVVDGRKEKGVGIHRNERKGDAPK